MNKPDQHSAGAPWDTYKRFPSYKEANTARHVLLEETEKLQVKIKWMAKTDTYAVKTRDDPSIEIERSLQEKRELKKKRKQRLQKKRRKK
jgi:hypothetical protein